MKKGRPLLASILEHGFCAALPTEQDNRLLIQFAMTDAYFKEQLNSRAYSEQLANLTKEFFGRSVGIKVELKEQSEKGESLAAKREREQREREMAAREAVKNHPIITEARALFGGELGPIEISDRNGTHE